MPLSLAPIRQAAAKMTSPSPKEKRPLASFYVPMTDQDATARASSEEACSEHDGLVFHRDLPAPPLSRAARICRALAVLVGVGIYSVLVVVATSLWWRRELGVHAPALLQNGPGLISSPLDSYVRYEARMFPETDTRHYKVMGPPDPERDAMWDDLTKHFFSEIPPKYYEDIDRLDEGIKLPNGNYVVLYTVNHLLHCLKHLHHSRYSDYYYPNMTDDELEKMNKHDMHCLEDLVQQVTCHVDTAPYTTRWYAKDILPTGNSRVWHQCADWKALRAELDREHIDPQDGQFVHPFFGPVVTDGASTAFPDRVGFSHEFLHGHNKGKVIKDGELAMDMGSHDH